ncbi:tyrosine-protein kinase-like otk [Actinia tenebrosa]|uniref:Tyrosine-protein kinase-like otk n=1 Tax=Actinia tenebrosa TaxID=6105 RepID=A0A6P8J0Z8_ACTTE|nr:tyrosine-protein kinase-like otk [Actinia tenebrosa]
MVSVRPVITLKSTDQKVFEGSTAIFACKAAGFPAPNITWLFNDDPIPWEHSIENDSLVLNDVRHGRHDGRYTCVATSKAGTVSTSASLLVYVKVSAHAVSREYIFSLTSQSAKLSCSGHGFPLPNITWIKDGLPVSLNQTDSVINETFIESGLNLGDVTYDQAGRYSCNVGNGVQEPISVAIEILSDLWQINDIVLVK